MSRLRLLATVPLCALIGCATVKSRDAGGYTQGPSSPGVAASEGVAGATQSPRSADASVLARAEGERSAVQGAASSGPEESAARASTASEPPPSVKDTAPSARLTSAEQSAHAPVAPGVVSTVVSEEKARPLVTGVIAAALEAVAAVTHPSVDAVGFWDAYRTPMQLARLIVPRSIQLVGERNLARLSRGMPNDCSGFVRLAYLSAGIDLVAHGFLAGENAVSAIFRRATEGGRVHNRAPRPGDLVFFRETYDRNRDGRRNDGMTHVGVVEGLADDGTVTFIHRGSKGVARSRMNLLFPEKHQLAQGGPVVNDFLRPATKGSRAYLTGELFVAFASPDGL